MLYAVPKLNYAHPPRRGVVLLAVLVVVVLLTLAAYQFSELMTAEYQAADSYSRTAQAGAMAASGIHYAAAALSNSEAFTNLLSSNPYDNPSVFHGILVQADERPRFQGRFSIIAPPDPDQAAGGNTYRFGCSDECGKLNLNALMRLDSSGNIALNVLLRLPNMTEEIANAILDWMDPDDEIRSNGAESEYYSSLVPPYRPKNGLLDSLEELLLVRGVTPQLLFGNDRNRNGIIDPEEEDGSGTVDVGWSAYLTIFSRERNVDVNGSSRTYVNDSDLNVLYEKLTNALGSDLANYIIAYRLYGPVNQGSGNGQQSGGGQSGGGQSGGSGQSGGQSGGGQSGGGQSGGGQSGGSSTPQPIQGRPGQLARGTLGNLQNRQPRNIASLWELVNSEVEIPGEGQNAPATRYPSPLNDLSQQEQYLPLVLDMLTTVRDAEIPARVNINTAPRAVLAALPGLDEADVQTILELRPAPGTADTDPIYQTPTWLLTEANFDVQTLRTLERYITGRTQVYRVQSLGYFDGGGPTARIEAIVDTNAGRPRILYWRDLTELGKGYALPPGP